MNDLAGLDIRANSFLLRYPIVISQITPPNMAVVTSAIVVLATSIPMNVIISHIEFVQIANAGIKGPPD